MPDAPPALRSGLPRPRSFHQGSWALVLGLLLPAGLTAAEPDDLEFFEKKVRPVLVQHCYKCHSAATKSRGGLTLDTRAGWTTGGDAGPAIVPGKPDESLLIEAIRYDGDVQMPPEEKLPDAIIQDLEEWVRRGAPDPRGEDSLTARPAPAEFNLAKAREFWAYQLPQRHEPPAVQNADWPRGDTDRFLLAKLESAGIAPGPDADRVTLVRRLYFDLIGLPPTPEQIDRFLADTSEEAYARTVDELLASPYYGERWGRHWLDVVRYAESLTLRGFVLPHAWRYRDYVIETFQADRPYFQFLQEQVAGDLLPAESLEERQRNAIAVTFLTLGNTNLEEQDKQQLRMDVVDEQLDTLGKAFLGQTIGCARCHDHKFDPIPTRDYYALAGILRNTKTLEHANVSQGLEAALPLPPEEEEIHQRHEVELAMLQGRIKEQKDQLAKLTKGGAGAVVLAGDLPGIVVDDTAAKRVGDWTVSQYTKSYVGTGYAHDANGGKGEKTLTFLPELPRAGQYEVRFAYTPGSNRDKAAPVTVFSADGEQTIKIDETLPPPIEGKFISLGRFKFEMNGQGFVIVSNEGTTQHVIADAVQFLPVDQTETVTPADPAAVAQSQAEVQQLTAALRSLETQLKELTTRGPQRPKTLTVREESKMEPVRIHIRGNVHQLGEPAPRGFLQAANYDPLPAFPDTESGRRELAAWLASPQNPLTARVFVNRVWHWLFGAGLVRTCDNFGATGELPSHPELLDDLAVRFQEQGGSTKWLIREIVLSHAYRTSSAPLPEAAKVDPENRLLARQNRRRLEAESIRDAILLVSGKLDLTRGGSTIKPGVATDYGYRHDDLRRSVYTPVFRNALPDLFEVFDFADPSLPTGVRNTSTVAPQALFLLNHPFVMEQSRAAAERLLAEPAEEAEQISRAFRRTLGRPPSDTELKLASEFLHAAPAGTAPIETWTRLYQSLFASLDFRHLD